MFWKANKFGMALVLAACFGVPAAVSASSIGLVCEGEYRTQEARIDSVAEDMFGATMHVLLVEHEGQFVELRLQAYEGDMKMPLQTYAVMMEVEEPAEDEAVTTMTAVPGLVKAGKLAGADARACGDGGYAA